MMHPLLSIPRSRIGRVESLLTDGATQGFDELARDTGTTFDPQLLSDLEAYALSKFDFADVSAVDQWLAPRLHFVLRLSRNAASDGGLWTWLACGPLRKYNEKRWPKREESTWWRYTSRDLLRNGIARLWWAAEMTRSGKNYELVVDALSSVRRFQFVAELRYSWYREAARAFTRTLTQRDASDEQQKELSKRFNVYLKTRALELWDSSDGQFPSSGPSGDWLSAIPTLAQATADISELKGPPSGVSDKVVEEQLVQWLDEMFDQI